MNKTGAIEKLLTAQEVSEILGISMPTLYSWRCRGRFTIPSVRVGSLVRYKAGDVAAFIEQQTTGASAAR